MAAPTPSTTGSTAGRALRFSVPGARRPKSKAIPSTRGWIPPGYDYPGKYDDPRSLLEAVDRWQPAAFNTAGYVKFHVRPPAEWESCPGGAGNEGLYVKNAFHFGGRRR